MLTYIFLAYGVVQLVLLAFFVFLVLRAYAVRPKPLPAGNYAYRNLAPVQNIHYEIWPSPEEFYPAK